MARADFDRELGQLESEIILMGGLVEDQTTGPEGAQVTDWSEVWLQPAILAAAVMVLFVLLFRKRNGGLGSAPAA